MATATAIVAAEAPMAIDWSVLVGLVHARVLQSHPANKTWTEIAVYSGAWDG